MNEYRIEAVTEKGTSVVAYFRARSMFHAIAIYHVAHPDDTIVAVKFFPN